MMISRSLFAAVWLASAAMAQPPLTTIQDVLYKADGTRFNGTLTIAWTSFEAVNRSAITTQTVTVTVVGGNLRVQLVPTTTAVPAANYSVKYNSDGRIQFSETWAVPSSVQPLRIRDVRMASTQAGLASAATASTPVQESDIVGLVADLGARPLTGPGYAAGRVAMVNPTGSLESVTGSPTDCVRVDGSSGPCGGGGGGGAQPAFVDGDSPTGIVDGANTTFTLSAVPNPSSSLALYRNGMLQKVAQDFTANGNAIQFAAAAAPQPGDTLLASYRLTDTVTAPPYLVSPQQINPAGLTAGQAWLWDGSFYVPGDVGNGGVSSTGSYSNPAWITSLAYAKITGVPSFENPLTFSPPLSRSVNAISLPLWGSGTRPVAANALGVSGNCANWGAAGLGDAGAPCGSGGGGAPTGAAGGSLSGSYPNPGLAGGVTIDPATGNISTPGSISSGVGSGAATALDFLPGTAPPSQAASTFRLRAPASIPAAFSWTVPSADAAGAIVSDGAGNLSLVGRAGTGALIPRTAALGVSGNCVSWGAAGLADVGSPCGVSGGVITSVFGNVGPAVGAVGDLSATGVVIANAVGSSKMAVVNTRRTVCIPIGGKNAAAAFADTDLADSDLYAVNAAATLIEITVRADAGTPQIILGRDRAGSVVNLTSAALATAATGGIACSAVGATTSVFGTTTCSATLQNTALNLGDWLLPVSGTAGGVAKQMSVCATWTVN